MLSEQGMLDGGARWRQKKGKHAKNFIHAECACGGGCGFEARFDWNSKAQAFQCTKYHPRDMYKCRKHGTSKTCSKQPLTGKQLQQVLAPHVTNIKPTELKKTGMLCNTLGGMSCVTSIKAVREQGGHIDLIIGDIYKDIQKMTA